MTTLRLTFLYPHLFRSLRAREPTSRTARRCYSPSTSQRALFATTSRNRQRFVERHGKAVEPFLQSGGAKESSRALVPELASETAKKPNPRTGKKAEWKLESSKEKRTGPGEVRASSSTPLSKIAHTVGRPPGQIGPSRGKSTLQQQKDAESSLSRPEPAPSKDGPLKQVLNIELPVAPKPEDLQTPHLHPPQYIHNFDTWTLVKEVEKGGFTDKQSISAMKAVRALLARNLDVAKEELVSKGDVENETYLFRAACSELRTEIQKTRRASDEKMRRERSLVQHEVDILNQKLTQELLTLKDELTGMFNDRKMAVRMDQREMDSAIQELSYKITVALNSDLKSEVEGLRWVLTRRAVTALVFMALMVLGSLRFASYVAHEEELERKRQDRLRERDRAHRDRLAHERGGDEEMGRKADGAGGEVDGDGRAKADMPASITLGSLAAN